VQITGIDYPATVQVNQTLSISTHLVITCSPVNQNVVARVDVISNETGQTITSNSTGIGVIQVNSPPYIKIVNVTVLNAVRAPSQIINWRLQIHAWVFTGPSVTANASRLVQVQVVQQVTSATSTELIQTSTTLSSTLTNFEVVGTLGAVVVLALLSSLMILLRRRKQKSVTTKPVGGLQVEYPKSAEAVSAAATTDSFSTGYLELDGLLGGGLPYGYAILFVSPPCDERDLLFRKIIESSLSLGNSVFFMSRDLGRSQDLARKYTSDFYVLTTQADKIVPSSHNISKIPSVLNLNDLNISFSNALDATTSPNKQKMRKEQKKSEKKRKVLIIDLLSDVLLEHKGLTTRKWLDDFIARRKSEGFTILATLNPLISSVQESQTVIDLFDGVIEIYEKKSHGRSRKFLIVKKMYEKKYMEAELLLDKDKLF
jgi:KaiC/GvpD/RAD55 family RecA-like ATPase